MLVLHVSGRGFFKGERARVVVRALPTIEATCAEGRQLFSKASVGSSQAFRTDLPIDAGPPSPLASNLSHADHLTTEDSHSDRGVWQDCLVYLPFGCNQGSWC